ncbi:MAG: LysR family transcriptional regulator [Lautropia sp.]
MFDWNDLKYLIAVARHGSTLAAARALNVNQSTVQRRIGELESHLGLRLVERSQRGYRLTNAGKAVLADAEQVATAVAAFEQRVDEEVRANTIRLTCPEPIAVRLSHSGLIERFRERHPGIRIEFILADRYVDLSKGEADVALRSGDTDGELVGRKLADSLWAVYASRDYVSRHGAPGSVEALRSHALVGLDHTMAKHRLATWLEEVADGTNPVAKANSVLGLVAAVKAGVGITALPTALGDSEPDLLRAFGPVAALRREWRILTLPALRRTPKVDALFSFLVSEGEAVKGVLTG